MEWSSLLRKKSLPDLIRDHQEICRNPETSLKRVLGVWDLVIFGIAAIVGAGIFSTIGNAAYNGGPAIIFLFVFTAIVCGFCALSYAEFASSVPVSGSAYTYSYIAFGELIAWIIGWDLLMEYAIGDIALTISWSQYFTGFLKYLGFEIPAFLTMDFFSAHRGFDHVSALLAQGTSWADLVSQGTDPLWLKGYAAWTQAPQLGSLRIICDLPTFLITIIVTWIILIGIEDSRRFSRWMVFLKLAVIFFVIAVGIFYINPNNWVPFAPNGTTGVLKGVSAIFFAYIGFDVISTTAEECKNPQRDLPKAMLYTLFFCTLIYVVLALVLTGVVNYKQLQVGDPLSFVFGPTGANIPWFSGVISFTAVIALAGVLLIYQLGQTRIWMVMSRDGLLPPAFSKIHPKYRTPWVSTLAAGVLVAVPSLFLNLTEVTDLNSIGTLFALALVSLGVLVMDPKRKDPNRKFKIPYVNAKYWYAGLMLVAAMGWVYFKRDSLSSQFSVDHIPLMVFAVEVLVLAYFSFRKNLSLITA